MATVAKIVQAMRLNPDGIRFSDAVRVATEFFGKARVSGSHHIFKMPWPGDPRVNLQESSSGKAKPYQIRQLLQAIDNVQR